MVARRSAHRLGIRELFEPPRHVTRLGAARGGSRRGAHGSMRTWPRLKRASPPAGRTSTASARSAAIAIVRSARLLSPLIGWRARRRATVRPSCRSSTWYTSLRETLSSSARTARACGRLISAPLERQDDDPGSVHPRRSRAGVGDLGQREACEAVGRDEVVVASEVHPREWCGSRSPREQRTFGDDPKPLVIGRHARRRGSTLSPIRATPGNRRAAAARNGRSARALRPAASRSARSPSPYLSTSAPSVRPRSR